MTVRQRPLGATGITVSEVGFAGDALAAAPAVADPTPVVHAALDAGISFFDAVPYGDGDGEAILARALRGEHRQVVLAARCVAFPHPVWGPDPKSWRPPEVRLRMEQALRRLGRDWLDLWLLEDPTPEATADEDLWAWLDSARAAGWIRSVGVMIDDEERATALVGTLPLDALSVRFGLLGPGPGRRLGATGPIAEGRVALLARDPLGGVDASGPADRLIGDFVFPTVDRTRSQAALAGVLAVAGLTSALVGPRDAGQSRELAAASAVPLRDEEREELAGRWDELDAEAPEPETRQKR